MSHSAVIDPEQSVLSRYAGAAQKPEAALCCPVDYDPRYLEVLPQEILEKDYGCGDPSRHVQPGETILDLGSGGGKICYIASQIVGKDGRVIGIDFNPDMLNLARSHQKAIAQKIGWDNVTFHRAKIQDLKTDIDAVAQHLSANPVNGLDGLAAYETFLSDLRAQPLIADNSIDCVLSNCVLNLVRPEDKACLFQEIYRVLKSGGRAAISDIVCDESVPDHLRADPDLWSGCISGAYQERDFLTAFEETGFHGIEVVERAPQPWQVIEGIEFRSMTVVAHKGKEGPCFDHKHAVIYKGPWRTVTDDDGHTLERGERMAVCEKTFRLYTSPPYADQLVGVEPLVRVTAEEARPFDCSRDTRRHPKESKGEDYNLTLEPSNSCC